MYINTKWMNCPCATGPASGGHPRVRLAASHASNGAGGGHQVSNDNWMRILIIIKKNTHTEILSEFCYSHIPFGSKSIGKWYIQSDFGLNKQDSEKISLWADTSGTASNCPTSTGTTRSPHTSRRYGDCRHQCMSSPSVLQEIRRLQRHACMSSPSVLQEIRRLQRHVHVKPVSILEGRTYIKLPIIVQTTRIYSSNSIISQGTKRSRSLSTKSGRPSIRHVHVKPVSI